MLKIKMRYWIKEKSISFSCEIYNRASAVITFFDKRWPRLADHLYPLFWAIADISDWIFLKAYPGSLTEIEQAWDHADEDWLNDFQKMIVKERILPI